MQPDHFWKYVSNFKRKENSLIQWKVGDHIVMDSKNSAHAFATHFKSIFSISSLTTASSHSFTSDFSLQFLFLLLKLLRLKHLKPL
jgi:hypothetical protein